MSRGFTLVELLVVITIVVVLLALLTPALDRAIYQAELAVCGSKLHAIAVGAQGYALQNNRRYPARPSIDVSRERAICIRSTYLDPSTPDDRPYLRGYIDINGHLNCPLTEEIDLENNHPDSALFSPFALWFGVRYRIQDGPAEKGMFRLGDRFTWTDAGDGSAPPVVHSFNVLAGDWDGIYLEGRSMISTHPDRDGRMWDSVLQDEDFFNQGLQAPQLQATWSYWHTDAGVDRGPVDAQYAFDDGSVRRFDDVAWDEGDPGNARSRRRLVWIPQYQSNARPEWKVHLPASH